MNTNKKTNVIIVVVVLVLLAIGYYGYQEFFTGKTIPTPGGSGNNSTNTTEIEPNSTSPLYLNPTLKKPNLNRTISMPDSYSVQASKIMTEKISGLIDALKKDSSSYADWNDLAMRFKMIGDYKGAEEIWTYLITASPRGTDAYINLGDLYMYYLHNNAKAEPMFLKAVEVSPRVVEAYRRIVDFYVVALKDKTKARNFLKASIAKYPDMELSLQPLITELK